MACGGAPPALHGDAIVAHAKADKVVANQFILQQIAQLYERTYGPSASTDDAHARAWQQKVELRQLSY